MTSGDSTAKIRVRLIYYLLSGLFWFSTSLITALYVLFLMEKGMNLSQVGLWSGAGTLTVILMEVPTGALADLWGRGRTFALANFTIASSLLLMALVPGTAVLYAGAVIFGTGRALSSGSLDAWFIDSLKSADSEVNIEHEIGAAGGVVLSALAAGCLIGSILPGLAAGRTLPGNLPPLALPLAADAVLKIILAFLSLKLVRGPLRCGSLSTALRASGRKAPLIARTAVKTIREQRGLIWLFIAGIGLALGFGSVETFWQPRFLDLRGGGPGRGIFGVVMASCFAAGALMSIIAPLVTRLFNGKRRSTALMFSLLISAAMMFLAAGRTPGWMAACMILVYAFGEGTGIPRKAMLNDSLPPEVRATMLSFDSLVSYLGFALTAVLGYFAQRHGIPAAWRVAATGVFLLTAVYLRTGAKTGPVPAASAPAIPHGGVNNL